MPTYKNNRSSALILSTFVGLTARSVEPGAEFVAHPDEVPESWLRTKDDKSGKPIVEKLSDSPDAPAPKRPEQPQTPASMDMLREELRAENVGRELELERMRQETERMRSQNLAAAAAQASAAASAAAADTVQAPASSSGKAKAAEKPADKDEKKS